MRLLHTSDWHLGRSLETCKRYEEFEAFLNWLNQTIIARQVEALVVAGDIFDNTAPANRAQELYYRFLAGLTGSCCRHVVVVAGNHDSPSFLDAPKELLKALNVHVVGTITANPEDEVVVLTSPAGEPAAVVCAVPYLRDRDIRSVEAGETIDQKGAKLLQGMQDHYARVSAAAETRRKASGEIPLIATGHLFTRGGQVIDEDGVKELYVGTLAHASTEMFPKTIDYLALGHLHVPQKVGGQDHMRYSGSPIAMGFGEAGQQKQVLLVEFSGRAPRVEEIAIPCFLPLIRVAGTFAEIQARLQVLVNSQQKALLEVEYTGDEILPNLQEDVYAATEGSKLTIIRVKNLRLVKGIVDLTSNDVALEDLDEKSVFAHCLEMNQIPDEQRIEMTAAYNEILASIGEEDSNRE